MALNFSGPHEANAALGFAGVAEALLFFLAVVFIVLEALEHVLHSSFERSASTSMSQATDRYAIKCHFKVRLFDLNSLWHGMTNNGDGVWIWTSS